MSDVLAQLLHASTPLVTILIKGGLVMIPRLAASVLTLAIAFERSLVWRRFHSAEAGEKILTLVTTRDLAQAMQVARTSRHPVARVLLAGLEHQYPAPGMAMEAATQAELHHLKRFLPVLDTIITLAPLLGLLGTITGMISAFGLVISFVALGRNGL